MVAQRFFLIREKIMNFEQSISILKKRFHFPLTFLILRVLPFY